MTYDDSVPVLRVVRGEPSDEEVAVLVTVLHAVRSAAAAAKRPAPTSRWSDRSSLLRRYPPRGRDAWRSSARAQR